METGSQGIFVPSALNCDIHANGCRFTDPRRHILGDGVEQLDTYPPGFYEFSATWVWFDPNDDQNRGLSW
jgi:hypothetical protein